MAKLFLILGSALGALSVAIGAFGAHALKHVLETNNRLETFETGVKYQFYHSLALILLGILMQKFDHRLFNYSGYGFFIGILIFSGSLYILSLTGITKWGAITPIGGVTLIFGWVALLIGIVRGVN